MYFCSIDLVSAYIEVRIAMGDTQKTEFLTSEGFYEYLVIPFGLVKASVVFFRLIKLIFIDMLNEFLTRYSSNILVYS